MNTKQQKLDRYISHSHVEIEECPLAWWKRHGSTYPSIRDLAKKSFWECQRQVYHASECSLLAEMLLPKKEHPSPLKQQLCLFI